MSRFIRERAARAPDVERSVRLAAQLRAGGVNTTDAPSARVIRGLADAGVFEAGGIMVGTHAFVALGNLLGRKWTSGSLRTQDFDIATSVDRDIDIAVSDLQADLPSTLESLAMGFLPVPALHPKHPSTSFKVRGQSLRVDLLCPVRSPQVDGCHDSSGCFPNKSRQGCCAGGCDFGRASRGSARRHFTGLGKLGPTRKDLGNGGSPRAGSSKKTGGCPC